MLSTVGNEITRIGAIIEHFLRYARPQVLSKTETDLDTLIGDVLNIVKLRAERKNIAIVSEVRKNTVCQCDTDQIKQALVNIILNAIEAIGENGTITVRAGCVKNVCEFSVEDTGGGIDGEILARIFDPYFTTRDNGTGLGLSEVHRIVTAHDGRIRAANTDSGGAVFTIELPLGEE